MRSIVAPDRAQPSEDLASRSLIDILNNQIDSILVNMSKWSDSEQKETMAILGVLFPVTAALYFELPASSAVDLPLLNASALLHPFFAAISICWGGSLVCMMASRLPIGKSNQ